MRKKYYPSRDGGFRRWNSYSVGYSEALQSGLIPDNKTNRNKYPQIFDKEPVEWHHGLRVFMQMLLYWAIAAKH